MRDRLDLCVIGIPSERRAEGEAFFDTRDTSGKLRCHRQIWVQIGPAHATFDPYAFGVFTAQTEARSTVIDRPNDPRWRKGAFLEPLVAVDVGREEIGVIRRVFQQTRHVGFHHRRHAAFVRRVVECVRAVLPERLVNVSGGANLAMVILRHKARRVTVLPSDLLNRIFGDGVVVGRQHRFGVFDVQFFLTSLGLTFRVFDRDTSGVKVITDRAHDAFFLGRLEDVVVFVVARNRL